MNASTKTIPLLDIGGEGRYVTALNLNPNAVKTLGPEKGQPIPKRLNGRIEHIPLPDNSVQMVVVERTPLTNEAIDEINRVIADGGTLVFRHVVADEANPHQRVRERIEGTVDMEDIELDGQQVQQLVIRRSE
ncbi:methyltransferase domain-containing protein [Aeoliella sp.]|uniref:methyltransferase domain-containing protein n=1 Tax=Aeoliella sp. TaxID=2795800 RepID=UPI003CCC0692